MSDEMMGADDFEQGLAARLAATADEVDRVPDRASVDAAVVALTVRQRRTRRAGALAAAAVVAVAGVAGVAAVGGDGDDVSVEAAGGPSTTTTTAPVCPDDVADLATGAELFDGFEQRCGPLACLTGPLVMDGIQVAHGYDWGVDLATGEVRGLDRPFGPVLAQPPLVVVSNTQGGTLLEDSALTLTPQGPDEQVGVLVSKELAIDLARHGEPVTAEQLAAVRFPPAEQGGGVVTEFVFAPGVGTPDCGRGGPPVTGTVADTTPAPATTTTEAAPTTTATTTIPTTTAVPTTAPASPRPPALLDLVEGGSAWAVYLVVVDGTDAGVGPTLDAARQRAQAEGYHAEFVNLACDVGAAEGLGIDPSAVRAAMALYFVAEADARAVVDLFAPDVAGPVLVRTRCVDTELDGSPYGETGDSDREQSVPG